MHSIAGVDEKLNLIIFLTASAGGEHANGGF